MSARKNLTVGTTIRILKTHAAALEQLRLKDGVAASVLVRVLLQEYFDGRIPQAEDAIALDLQRAKQALCSAQFKQRTAA
jgi:hypothetical protein